MNKIKKKTGMSTNKILKSYRGKGNVMPSLYQPQKKILNNNKI